MAGNLFSIAKTGLFAAQAGLATTGHNITNANVIGYSRQTIEQESGIAQDFGYGFVGSGTEVTTIKRFSNEFLNTQVRTAQANVSALTSYGEQISQIDNVLADANAGLSPAMQDFFKSVQAAASGSSSTAARQGLLSGGETLVARFQSLDARIMELREGVNTQIESNVTLINSYAQQIAELNKQVAAFSNGLGSMPNDLLDRRDQLVVELNKHVRATVMPGTNNSVTVSIGSGQPLVVGEKSYQLAITTSSTDPLRLEVGYVTGTKVTRLADNSLQGGELGGLLEFRTESLDRAQNAIGRIAIGMAETFNAQHRLGWDLNGAPGGNFFNTSTITPRAADTNNSASTLAPTVTVADVSALTLDDYDMVFDGLNFTVSSVPGNQPIASFVQGASPVVINGLSFDVSVGTANAGDRFRIRPLAEAASGLSMKVNHVSQIAAAAPIATGATTSNTGSGTITEGTIDASYLAAPLAAPVTFTYNKATNELTGVMATVPPSAYPAMPFTYTPGTELNIGGMHFTISGVPNDGDTFTVGPNSAGVGDNRNMRLLGALQTTNVFDGGASSFQGAYAELVSFIGNKTREVQVNADAGTVLLNQANASQQQVSGVNLDEEAANLVKYQQAYQAAGKAMQIAATLFDSLLSIGR